MSRRQRRLIVSNTDEHDGPGGRQKAVGDSSYPIHTSELVVVVEDAVQEWKIVVVDAKSKPDGRR